MGGMGKGKLFFIVINMLAVVGALAAGLYIYGVAGRFFARDVVYIAPRINETRLHFPLNDVEILNLNFPGYTIAPEIRGNIFISTGIQETSAYVFYTDAAFFGMHSMDFIEGSYWQGRSDENVMVVNEALAWRLFGATENIAGKVAWIGNETFIMVGVVRQDPQARDPYTAWMPVSQSPPNLLVSALYIRPNEVNPLAVYQSHDMLRFNLSRNPDNYSIVDINRLMESLSVRFRVLLYVTWLIALILLSREAWRRFASRGSDRYKSVVAVGLPLLGAVLSMYILLGVNDILLWLPNFTHPSANVFQAISAVGILPPEDYLPYGLRRLGALSRMSNYAFVIGIVGLVNLLFSLRFRGQQ